MQNKENIRLHGDERPQSSFQDTPEVKKNSYDENETETRIVEGIPLTYLKASAIRPHLPSNFVVVRDVPLTTGDWVKKRSEVVF